MKRMSEVLARELPITGDELLHLIANETSAMDDSYIAHAINHVDVLADALAAILADYNRHTAIYPVDMTDDHCANLHNLMFAASSALNAYRGAK